MFNAIIDALGTDVNISEVKEQFPDMVGYVMRKGERIVRGKYRLTRDFGYEGTYGLRKRHGVTQEVVMTEAGHSVDVAPLAMAVQTTAKPHEHHHRMIDVIDNIGDEDLVPKVNKKYVPWGCYELIRTVIKSEIFAPVLITGDSGNGKTFGVEQACAREGRELIIMNITNETSEEDLIGSYILQDGNMIWRDGPVIVAMRRGAVLCLDEIDQGRPAIMTLQTVAQGKPYFIKKTNELVEPKAGFCLIGTGNTKGDGVGSDKFSGAQVLNEAFVERFNIVIEQEYPTDAVERRILKMHSDNEALIKRLAKFAKITRTAYNDGAVTHCITTRRLVQICQNISIFKDEKFGVKLAVSRFSSENRDVFVELYDKLIKEDAREAALAAQQMEEPKASMYATTKNGDMKDPF